jgi:hypothetical protein
MRLEKFKAKKGSVCTDGNILTIGIESASRKNIIRLECIYKETNSEAVNLLERLKKYF